MSEDLIYFMDYMWANIEDDILTVGLSEKAFEDFDEITEAVFPEESAQVSADEVCGELNTDQGPVNLYSPLNGEITEVNEAALQNPKIIQDECYGDGWLFKIRTENFSQIEALSHVERTDIDSEYQDNDE